MESVTLEHIENKRICDVCKYRQAKWIKNNDGPFEERIFLCGPCASEEKPQE